ncbi:cilia- and flagella- associated protein 210 isoform X1 [Triplophysa rosa]|uniref:Coiled-coil domain-containing protein 173 n=2 Tax=Triplophysa rosa TaxID=992332 RepID=A0A9W8C6S5_TRIRA|nr:cilia- and flagella- associated protein 210 isoform X1 [Triplophysa rosa]KAI7808514.1 putative coiled-coil domain-containing protein 173 [Triplophysa rosa]
MSAASITAGVVQYGRRKGSGKQGIEANRPPDLRQVAVLSKSDWLRIQDSVNGVNQHNQSLIEAREQREALHVRSKEVVKHWSNTIAGQRQKKLEAKKIREAIEEEERMLIDIEEANYQAQIRKEAIEKAKTQQYYQTDRVKEFHRALLLAEVLKERETQIELKHRQQKASKDLDKDILAVMANRDEQTLQEEQQKSLQRKQEQLAVAESLKQQIKNHEVKQEQEKQEVRKEAWEIERLRKLRLLERATAEQKKEDEKRNMMKAHREHLANREAIRAAETQRQEDEEEKQEQLASHKKTLMKLRKEKQEEMYRELQRHRETIIEKLAALKQEQTNNEDERIAKAVAEREARQIREQQRKEAKHTAMLNSITAHREITKQEQEIKAEEERQKELEMLNAKREADRIFMEKQEFKAQKGREEGKALQDTYIRDMAEKRARNHRTRKEEQNFAVKNKALVIEEELQFQRYAKHVIETAEKAGRNTFPLSKASKEGIGGGLGPVFGGLRPSYLVHDESDVQMPKYVSNTTQNIKELNETTNIHQAKKRLGFTW